MLIISRIDGEDVALEGRKEVSRHLVFGVEGIAVRREFFFILPVFVGGRAADDHFVATHTRRAQSRVVYNGAAAAFKYRKPAEPCVDGYTGVKAVGVQGDDLVFAVISRSHELYEVIRGIVKKVVIECRHDYLFADEPYRPIAVGAVGESFCRFLPRGDTDKDLGVVVVGSDGKAVAAEPAGASGEVSESRAYLLRRLYAL